MKSFNLKAKRCPEDYICDSCSFNTADTGYMEAWKDKFDIDFPGSIYDDRFILCFDCYKDLPRKLAQ